MHNVNIIKRCLKILNRQIKTLYKVTTKVILINKTNKQKTIIYLA